MDDEIDGAVKRFALIIDELARPDAQELVHGPVQQPGFACDCRRCAGPSPVVYPSQMGVIRPPRRGRTCTKCGEFITGESQSYSLCNTCEFARRAEDQRRWDEEIVSKFCIGCGMRGQAPRRRTYQCFACEDRFQTDQRNAEAERIRLRGLQTKPEDTWQGGSTDEMIAWMRRMNERKGK